MGGLALRDLRLRGAKKAAAPLTRVCELEGVEQTGRNDAGGDGAAHPCSSFPKPIRMPK